MSTDLQPPPHQDLCSFFFTVYAALMVHIRTEATDFHSEQHLNET